MRVLIIFAGLWLGSAVEAHPAAAGKRTAADAQPRVISAIRIERSDVFEPDSLGVLRPAGQLANAIHVTTRQRVIRDLLLFSEGDSITSPLARESERVLRESGLFESARVQIAPRGDSADVTVVTRDLWSTQLIMGFGSTGGVTEITSGLLETNVFGTGNAVSGIYQWSDEQDLFAFGFQKRRFFGRYALASVGYVEGQDGISRSASVAQPFYTALATWSGGISAGSYRGRIWLYRDGQKSGSYRSITDDLRAHVSLYRGQLVRWRAGAGLSLRDQVSKLPTGDARGLERLRNDRRRQLTLALGALDRRFLRVQELDRHGVDEDLALGHLVSIALGAELKALGSSKNRPYLAFAGRSSARLGAAEYGAFSLDASTYWQDAAPVERDFELSLKAFSNRWRYQAPAVRLLLRRGERVSPDELFYLGAESGLRGYPYREFRGSTVLLANAENRVFPVFRVLFVGIGFTAFADAGYAWEGTEPLRWRDIRNDVGVGLRVGNPKSATSVMRLDFGRGLGPDGEWVVSLISGNVFRLAEQLDFEPPLPRRFGGFLD